MMMFCASHVRSSCWISNRTVFLNSCPDMPIEGDYEIVEMEVWSIAELAVLVEKAGREDN